jgi:hypothetical protein
MNCRNKSVVLNEKVIYFSPHDFMACSKQGNKMMCRPLRGNWSNFRLEPPCNTQWNACDWWLVTCASCKIFDYISDLRTWIAVYTSDALLIAIKENKALKISHCHIQNSYLLNKLRIFVCILPCVTSRLYLKRSRCHSCLIGSPVSHAIIAYFRKAKISILWVAPNCIVFILKI